MKPAALREGAFAAGRVTMQDSVGGASAPLEGNAPVVALIRPRSFNQGHDGSIALHVLFEASREREGTREQIHVLPARNLDCTKALQVRGEPLCIEQDKAFLAQPFDQRPKRHL